MSLYYVMQADGDERGTIVMEGITSEQLQRANLLLEQGNRVGKHFAASQRANMRDRALRYGTHKQPPVDLVQPRPITHRTKPRTHKRVKPAPRRQQTTLRTTRYVLKLLGFNL
jgi:hypothetical protein